MRKPLNRKRAVTCAAVLLGVMLLVFVCSAFAFYSPEKHTGYVTIDSWAGDGVQFVRPSGEIFRMNITRDSWPSLQIGDEFSDVVYVDSRHDERYFIKALRVKRGGAGEMKGCRQMQEWQSSDGRSLFYECGPKKKSTPDQWNH